MATTSSEKMEERRSKVGSERENAKWGFNPQWRAASQWEFVFTYGEAEQQAEVDRLWAKITRAKGTVAKATRGSNDLKAVRRAKTASQGKRVECVSELRRGGSVSVKHFAAHVADLNGKTEALPHGELRIAGRMPSARDLFGLRFD